MKYLPLLGACVALLTGCTFTGDELRDMSRNDARSECRKVTDASMYLECMKRADTMHAKR